jgi:hypothetical protein
MKLPCCANTHSISRASPSDDSPWCSSTPMMLRGRVRGGTHHRGAPFLLDVFDATVGNVPQCKRSRSYKSHLAFHVEQLGHGKRNTSNWSSVLRRSILKDAVKFFVATICAAHDVDLGFTLRAERRCSQVRSRRGESWQSARSS